MIEIVADNGTAQRLEEYVSHLVPEVTRPAFNQINLSSNHYLNLASLISLLCVSFSLDKLSVN